ncbi:hypothetical protein [Roseicyclus persicicus]|uniref:DoxX family protein n=1 Tax=Roseicyclus persicicus TaxID=2650661 RepID=A0A7X6H0N0_9RHOB|nr:hypothetical protein [Roseibacterium persicicum]NKX44632.1 hypothetical protein [Roseibacterium persicicum]
MTHVAAHAFGLDRDSARRTAKALKTTQALVFLGLGGWCLFAPQMVETLSLKPEFHHLSATTALLMGCFGAQAVLCGSLMLLCRFTAWTFLGFGLLASIPFFVFNAWFVWVAEMFTALMLVDFAGNLSFLLIGLLGWRLMRDQPDPV